MKKVEYFCNLCGEKKNRENLRTFYYNCATTPQKYELKKDGWDMSDKHLCNDCINIIKEK